MKPESKYIAIIVYESSSQETGYKPLYEESIVELKAGSIEEARRIVNDLAKQREHSYKNAYGELISWKLRQVIDVNEVLEGDGIVRELYSRHFFDIDGYEKFEKLAGRDDES